MGCMHKIQSNAVEATKKECKRAETKKVAERDEELTQEHKQELHQLLKERGVNLEHLDFIESYFEKRLSGIAPAAQKGVNRKRAGDELKRGATSKVAKRESRKGKKEITGREGFQHWNAEKKLDFIHAQSDENTSEYRNDARQWLMRVNPIAACFRECCDERTDLFLSKHGNGKGNFSVSGGVSGCAECCAKKK